MTNSMKKFETKNAWPYLIAIVAFLAISVVYFSPVLEGKKLRQADVTNWKGMSKEIKDYREASGEEPLWTNSMFGGMPAYQISVHYKNNFVHKISKVLTLWLPRPLDIVFLYFLGFFILLLVMRVNPWLSFLGAIGFAFSSYFFIILEAGHITKAIAIAYMGPVLAGIILAYRGKYLWGLALTAFFLSIELSANHLQITYYLLMIVVLYGIFQFFENLREKKLPHFFKASGVLVVAAILAVSVNIANIWSTYEYGKYTIRGKSELTSESHNRTSGLDIDYATQWSYGVPETFTLLIPDFMGGGSGRTPDMDSKTYEELQKYFPKNQANQYINFFSLYWGKQPFTSGPVYAGAIFMFLFILGLFVVKGKYKWWLLSATVLSIMLAWGKNFMPLTEFFLHYMPGYNKFRAVSTTLVIAEFCIPLLGILAVKEIASGKIDAKATVQKLAYALGTTVGLILLVMLFAGSAFDFSAASDARLLQAGLPQSILDALEADRLSLLRSEGIRSILFILIAAISLWAIIKQKIKKEYAFITLILAATIDMWAVNRRYLSTENFEDARKVESPFTPSAADQQILQDNDPNFRVLNTTVNTFNDASTSYYHKSIGGYHGAKLRRYQEIIDNHIANNNMKVLNMLNTKYFIMTGADKQAVARLNPAALGNAWTVDKIRFVDNADEEIDALADFAPASEAIVDKRFEGTIGDFVAQPDSAASIKLKSYLPNELIYEFNSEKDEAVVFSEIYYDKGWKAYIDGEEAPYFRTNYILRGMIIPKGQHEIKWEFRPKAYYTGTAVSGIASGLIIILMLIALGKGYKEALHNKPKED